MITTALYNEIANTRMFEMQEAAFFNHARMFLSHYRSLTAEEKAAAIPNGHFVLSSSNGFKQIESWDELQSDGEANPLEQEDAFIHIIRFSGPMMRNGGACAYGSMEMRDMIMAAADMPNCIGHIFIVDTPGGSSATKDDLQEAIEYAHSKGQDTVMQVDGMVMSAGIAWASMCKKRYARNPHNLFGCMGTYASFYTNKNKDVNTVTQEMFHVVYADGSPEKNKAWRDAAEGDQEAVLAMVNRENDRYKAIIRAGIPNVTEEQLKGGEWEAQEVVGTLCDGIRSLDEIISEMLQGKSVDTTLVSEEEQQEEQSENSINNQQEKTMGKSYDKIKEALEWPTLESGKDNSLWLHEVMADQLTAFVENAERIQNALEAKQADVSNLTKQIEQLKAEHEAAIKATAEAVRKEVEEEAAKSLEAVKADKLALEEKVTALETKVAEQESTIKEKEETIQEMASKPAPMYQPAPHKAKQAQEEKSILASDCKNRKGQKQAHEDLMQMLRDRM